MNYLVIEFGEPLLVFLVIKFFRIAIVGHCRLDKHKAINNTRQFVTPYIKKLKFVEKWETIIYHKNHRPYLITPTVFLPDA